MARARVLAAWAAAAALLAAFVFHSLGSGGGYAAALLTAPGLPRLLHANAILALAGAATTSSKGLDNRAIAAASVHALGLAVAAWAPPGVSAACLSTLLSFHVVLATLLLCLAGWSRNEDGEDADAALPRKLLRASAALHICVIPAAVVLHSVAVAAALGGALASPLASLDAQACHTAASCTLRAVLALTNGVPALSTAGLPMSERTSCALDAALAVYLVGVAACAMHLVLAAPNARDDGNSPAAALVSLLLSWCACVHPSTAVRAVAGVSGALVVSCLVWATLSSGRKAVDGDEEGQEAAPAATGECLAIDVPAPIEAPAALPAEHATA